MYPHSGRRHYVYDRSRGSVVSTSSPIAGSTPRASKLAASSYYIPTGRRVMAPTGEWAPTDSTVPMRAPFASDAEARFVPGHRRESEAEDVAAFQQPQPMTDRHQEELQERHIEEAEQASLQRGDWNAVSYDTVLRSSAPGSAGVWRPDELEMKEMKQPEVFGGTAAALPRPGELAATLRVDLQDLLRRSGLFAFYPALANHGIESIGHLAYLTETDLRDLGLNMLERAKLRETLLTHSTGARGSMVDEMIGAPSGRLPPNPNPHSPPPRSPTPPMRERKNVQPTAPTVSSAQRQRQKKSTTQPATSSPSVVQSLRTGGGTPKSMPSRFKSTHPPHPSHPPSMYDYLDRPPRLQSTSLHAPVVDRAGNIPADARHISPQPNPEAYMSSRTREITGTPQRPAYQSNTYRQQRGGQRDPNAESTPYALPGETIRANPTRQAAAASNLSVNPPAGTVPQPYASPPLVHAADYPLETPIHGDQQWAHTMECVDGGEHRHNFDESRHPPHLSHPMPASDIVPHARRTSVFSHPPHPAHPMPPPSIVPHARREALAPTPLSESESAFRQGRASVPRLDLSRAQPSNV